MSHLCDDLTNDSYNNAIHHGIAQSVMEEFRTKYLHRGSVCEFKTEKANQTIQLLDLTRYM